MQKLSLVAIFYLAIFNISSAYVDYTETDLANPEATAARMNNLGVAALENGDLTEAVMYAGEAVMFVSDDPRYRMNYGSALFIQGTNLYKKAQTENLASVMEDVMAVMEDAERQFKKAIELMPTGMNDVAKAHCCFLLGDIYFHIYKRNNEAIEFYSEAVRLDPKHPKAAIKLEKVKSQ